MPSGFFRLWHELGWWLMIESNFRNQYKLRINVRPVKRAYFIRDDDWATLTDVIQLAGTQWGGIRSLILPVKADLSMAPIFEQLLSLHEPDYFVGYVTQSADQDYEAHNQLQRQLIDLFPKRRISLQQGQFYASHDMTAHALHILVDEDLRDTRLTTQKWPPNPASEHVPLAIYGAIYPGQEEYYAKTIQVTHEEIAIGSREFWASQINSDPFASVINLTAYHISAYMATDWFESNEFDIVLGDDINSICMYWNFRATREAAHFSSGYKRRTLLAPMSAVENRSSLDSLINVVRTNFPTPGMSSNLNIVFNVWDEQARDRLLQTLSQATEQLERLTGEIHASRTFGREAPQAEDLTGKKLTYIISLPLRMPGSYREGVATQPALTTPPLTTPLTFGRNEVLYEPPAGFRNRYGGGVAVDFECEVWNRFPFDKHVAELIEQNGWFSRYGLTAVYGLADSSHYLAFNMPREWETLEAYFRGRGVTIRRSQPDDYANGVIRVLGGWPNMAVLASKPAYLLLDILALRSTKKVSQRIVQALGLGTSDIDTIKSLLQDIEALPELKGIPKTYEQLCSDARLTAYRRQLLGILSNLSQHQVLKRGMYLPCPNCGAPDWYPLNHLGEELTCSGCTHSFVMPVEQPPGSEIRWQYRLNTLINRAVDQDVLVPLLAVNHLTHAKEATCRVIGLELEKNGETIGDLDYVFVSEQKLYSGECKAGTELAVKDVETALTALELGVVEFRFCTVRQFSSEAQALIAEAKKRATTAGHPETAISMLSGDQLLGEAI